MLRKNYIFILLIMVIFLMASCTPAAYKKGVKLSGDYPEKDLPIYDDAVVFECDEDSKGVEISYGVQDGDVDDVADFYKEYFEDEGIVLTKEKDEKDEYSAKGAYEDFEFEISIEEAKGKYEEKVFETVVEVEIEFIDEDNEDGEESNTGGGSAYEEEQETQETEVLMADPSQQVDIPDEVLEQMVRDAIDMPEGDITAEDMGLLYGLSIKYDENPVYDLTGLEYAYNMYSISYYGGSEHNGRLKSLAPIANLPLLEYISVSYSVVEEAPPVFSTPLMTRASFIDLNLNDFSFFSTCTGMTELTVDDCGITSLEFVRNMQSLVRLNAEYNNISDISPVEGKTALTSITLQQNNITDISVLAGCVNLENVIISYNYITTLAPLHELQNLIDVRAYEEIGEKKIDQGSIDDLVARGVEVYYHE